MENEVLCKIQNSDEVVTKADFMSFQSTLLKSFESLSSNLFKFHKQAMFPTVPSTTEESAQNPIPAMPKAYLYKTTSFEKYVSDMQLGEMQEQINNIEDLVKEMNKNFVVVQ